MPIRTTQPTHNPPTGGVPAPSPSEGLRVPQARVLVALMPSDPTDHPTEWRSMTTPMIATAIGTSTLSDLIRRAMRGLPEGSSSGDAHPGLLAKGYVETFPVNVEGLTETYYRITPSGLRAITDWLKHHKLPERRSAESSTNRRYKEKNDV